MYHLASNILVNLDVCSLKNAAEVSQVWDLVISHETKILGRLNKVYIKPFNAKLFNYLRSGLKGSEVK